MSLIERRATQAGRTPGCAELSSKGQIWPVHRGGVWARYLESSLSYEWNADDRQLVHCTSCREQDGVRWPLRCVLMGLTTF